LLRLILLRRHTRHNGKKEEANQQDRLAQSACFRFLHGLVLALFAHFMTKFKP
jgi:hypothetical protein